MVIGIALAADRRRDPRADRLARRTVIVASVYRIRGEIIVSIAIVQPLVVADALPAIA